jgi:hypothetical protein
MQWYERLAESGDGDRREFNRGERVIVIKSIELRMVGIGVTTMGQVLASEEANGNGALINWQLDRDD